MKKTNILFMLYSLQMGGGERLVYNLIQNIDREKYSPHIIWFDNDHISQEFADLDIPLFRVHKERSIDIAAIRQIYTIVKENDIGYVNSHTFMQTIYAVIGCRLSNTKLIYTAHSGWELSELPLYWRLLGSILFTFVHSFIAVSDYTNDTLSRTFRIKKDKITTIYNGVDIDRFGNDRDQQDEAAEDGVFKDTVTLGIVANLKRIKNHIFLLQALKEVVKKETNIRLLIVGQGFTEDEENTEDLIREYIRHNALETFVQLLGYRQDVAALLREIDIFCLTSLQEGLPISIIEAMASGLPIIGTNVMGIREIIRQDENGFLVELNDVEGLMNALLTLIRSHSLRQAMGRKSRLLAEEHYSIAQCATRFQSHLEAVE